MANITNEYGRTKLVDFVNEVGTAVLTNIETCPDTNEMVFEFSNEFKIILTTNLNITNENTYGVVGINKRGDRVVEHFE